MNRRSFITQLAAFAYVGSIPARASAQSPHTHQHSFGDAEKCSRTIAQLDADPHLNAIVRSQWNGAPALLYGFRR